MSMKLQVKFLLMCGCILHALTAEGVNGQCSTPPINQVVYEGDQSTIMTCNSPTKVSWFVFPTTEELFKKQITNYSDDVIAYPSLYNVTQTNLNIEIGQSYATPNISTSGLYIAQYNSTASNNKIGAKLVVIRNGPTCNCSANNSVNQTLTCSITYADANYNPIYAKFKWTADGALFAQSTISTRTRVNNAFTSTYAITTSLYDTRTFQCNVTFAKPTSVSLAYIATNAPAFYAICNTSFCGMTTTASPTSATKPTTTTMPETSTEPTTTTPPTTTTEPTTTTPPTTTTEPTTTTPPTTTTEPTTTTPPTTTTEPTTTSPASTTEEAATIFSPATTSGPSSSVRSPKCSRLWINATASNLSCSVTFADTVLHPIHAIMTWRLNGSDVASHEPELKRIGTVLYSNSTITINVTNRNAAEEYQCVVTFSATTDIKYDWIAENAPKFEGSCSVKG